MARADEKSIGWVDWTINPIRFRCPGPEGTIANPKPCFYCYMQAFYRRFPEPYPERPTYFPDAFKGIRSKRGKRIWLGSSTDMFHSCVPSGMIQSALDVCWAFPQHTYYFLTKNPKRYAEFKFPRNCYLGLTLDTNTWETLTRASDFREAIFSVRRRQPFHSDLPRPFVSCEPLLEDVAGAVSLTEAGWIIIGANSQKGAKPPRLEWIEKLIADANRWHHPVYIKHNLAKYYPDAPWANRREKP